MSSRFFTADEQRQIVSAIESAEANCSGEIRVHIDRRCPGNVLDAAADVFASLGMQKTALRNGVLFYVAVDDRKFAVIGDCGINSKVPDGFWNDGKAVVTAEFSAGRYVDGLTKGIILCGEQLKAYFPHSEDDIDELPNEITYGNK